MASVRVLQRRFASIFSHNRRLYLNSRGITWRFPMNPIGLQKKLDDLVNLVGSLTKTTKEKHVDSPHFRDDTLKNPICESRFYSPSTHQSDSRTSSPHHTPVTHFSASFVETNRGHHYSRDHLSFSNLRVAAPPCRSLPSLDGRTSLGSSVGSVHYDSPLRPTHNHPSQPLASPDLNPASVNLIENRIRKEMSPEPETECIHFVDANDITDDKGFFEDETEVTKLDSLYDLNPDLGVLEPLDLDTLVHLDPNDIKDIPLDKVCLDDINLISKEADLTLNPLKLSSEDYEFIISPNKTTPNNSGLILNNSDVNNLESEVSQLDLLHELDPNLFDPESFELRVITKHDPIENINMSSEDSNLNLKDSEPNFNNEPHLTLLDPNLGVAPLDLHLKESVLPDWADHITPPTDLNENISPHFHVVPTSTLDTLPRLLSPIPTGDSLGYVIMFESDDPSSYHTPDSYILPTTSLSFPVKDLPSPSWLTLLDHLTTPRRLSVTLAETPYGDALLAKDVFIAPPTPVPLNRETFCPLILRLPTSSLVPHANLHLGVRSIQEKTEQVEQCEHSKPALNDSKAPTELAENLSKITKDSKVNYTAISNLKTSRRHDLAMIFTCKVCDTRSVKTMCRESYETGVVVAKCGGCNNLHLIADHLGWFGECGNIEDLLAARGEEVRKGSIDTLNLTLEDLIGAKSS
ncbi:hypothetical protein M5K25_027325 [Dendrobium thyrsiflorum]|uniref:DNL-type domain-containing protein n=1 Tax=Dendrobium thyrsiflorum TaxID=117978 RepID=A0ABD0U031_DENTH